MVRVCESNIIFLCVHASICCPSICLSHYLLLNHWAEFSQTCYITSPHGKGVREQHFFPCVHRPFICLSHYLLLNHWADFNQTCYITSPHGKGVQEQHYFSICPSDICPSRYLLLNHSAEFNQTCYMTSPYGKSVGEQVHLSVMLLATLATRVICDGVPLIAHSSNIFIIS